jgi:hypothetical protein
METLTLTEEQILVKHLPLGNLDSQGAKTLTPNYIVANDDTDGSDSDDGGGGSSDSDGS